MLSLTVSLATPDPKTGNIARPSKPPVLKSDSAPSSSSPPLRIVHLTLASAAGGLSRYLIDLSVALRDWGHEVTILGDRGAWHDRFEAAGLDYRIVPLESGPRGLWTSAGVLSDVLKQKPVDVLHSHYRRASLMGRLGRWRAGTQTPLLYTLHLSHIDVSGWRRWLSDFGDHTHVASQDAADWLKGLGTPADKISLVPHGIHTEQYPTRGENDRRTAREQLGLPIDATVACFVGRLDHPKNETWCLDVLADPRCAGVHLLVAGEGPREQAFRQEVASRGLASRVHVLGHADPLPVYQASDLLLLPSLREGFSLVCAEAMSVGVPHVRTRTSGSAELTIQNETGIATEIDRDAFVAAASEALANPTSLQAMGDLAADRVREHFQFQQQVTQTLALYRRLCGPA